MPDHYLGLVVAVLIEIRWGMYASANETIIGSGNAVLPLRRQVIIWTILLIGPLGSQYNIFTKENWFENTVCKMAFILSRPRYVNTRASCWRIIGLDFIILLIQNHVFQICATTFPQGSVLLPQWWYYPTYFCRRRGMVMQDLRGFFWVYINMASWLKMT